MKVLYHLWCRLHPQFCRGSDLPEVSSCIGKTGWTGDCGAACRCGGIVGLGRRELVVGLGRRGLVVGFGGCVVGGMRRRLRRRCGCVCFAGGKRKSSVITLRFILDENDVHSSLFLSHTEHRNTLCWAKILCYLVNYIKEVQAL